MTQFLILHDLARAMDFAEKKNVVGLQVDLDAIMVQMPISTVKPAALTYDYVDGALPVVTILETRGAHVEAEVNAKSHQQSAQSFAFLAVQLLERKRFGNDEKIEFKREDVRMLSIIPDELLAWCRKKTPNRFGWERFIENTAIMFEAVRSRALG